MKLEDYLADKLEARWEEISETVREEARLSERHKNIRTSLSLLIEAGVDHDSALAKIAEKYGITADEVRRIELF